LGCETERINTIFTLDKQPAWPPPPAVYNLNNIMYIYNGKRAGKKITGKKKREEHNRRALGIDFIVFLRIRENEHLLLLVVQNRNMRYNRFVR